MKPRVIFIIYFELKKVSTAMETNANALKYGMYSASIGILSPKSLQSKQNASCLMGSLIQRKVDTRHVHPTNSNSRRYNKPFPWKVVVCKQLSHHDVETDENHLNRHPRKPRLPNLFFHRFFGFLFLCFSLNAWTPHDQLSVRILARLGEVVPTK